MTARLPKLPGDPDVRMLRAGWIAFALAAALLVVLLSIGVAPVLIPFLAVFGGLIALWPAWRGGRWLWREMKEGPQQPWQGAYYEFDGRQVRILFDEDGQVWLAADDILDVFGLAGHARDRERIRLIAGRDGLRRAPGTALQCFTERGLRAWLERRSERRVAQFTHWLDTQVLAPHRRRLELSGRLPPPPP